MAQVGTRGLKKYFGEVRAVDGVDLTTREGEFLVLLGPSGCGKTTLLRMIAGLERPSAGEVLIDDHVVNELPPRVRKIAMVFQNYALYPHMTVFKNIVFPLKAQRVPKDQWKEKVVTAASMFGIEKLLNRKPRELSGGERQRVALARAMVREPTVFLFDEPLSNLDAKLRHSARYELKRFQEEIGITTIYVTHDQVEAMGLGDRIAVMSQGTIRQIGTPHEVYHEPANTFVATFMGSPPMNLFERDDVLVGFRPECFLPKEIYDVNDDLRSFQFRVRRIEHLGSDRLVYGSLDRDGDGQEAGTIAKVPLNVSITIQEGHVYEFAVLAQNIKFFDKVTGLRTEKRSF
ncbi:MAG: ATP-binding cassette domain-containing protein [Syntrophobacteria bacterium]|nr:ATP-binding cassette domain-containing protein [Deltaproteobacteria bacterium]